MRRLSICAVLLIGALTAQGGKLAYIDLRLDTSGHGALTVSIEGAPGIEEFLTDSVLEGLIRPLGCENATLRGQTLSAYCRDLLSLNGANLSGAIRMDSLFQPLFDLGIDDVVVFVHVPDAAENPSTAETAQWTQVLREGRGIRYGHRSGPGHPLPPTLQIEYPARHHAEAGQAEMRAAIASVCCIIFLPALFAAAIARRAKLALNSGAGAPIGEDAMWIDLLIQFIGLVWFGLMGALDLKDAAMAQFAGEPVLGAIFAFALLVAPPLLATVNCATVWSPIPERAGVPVAASFGRDIFRRVMGQARLLVPAACLSVAFEVVPRDGAGAFITLGCTAGVSLVIAFLSRTCAIGVATRLTSGDFYERAQALAARARTPLRTLWMLGENVPANAYAIPGKQIALAPALVRQLTPTQLDAVIAHELSHLRHNDFKIPVLIYTAYLSVVAPFVNHAIGGLIHPAWMLLPQSVVLLLLMGLLTRHAEYRADREAAKLTSGEDAIRALCRLHRSLRQPMTLHPVSECLVSHPSLVNRARAIAHDQQQSTDWLRGIMLDEWECRPTPQPEPQPTPLLS